MKSKIPLDHERCFWLTMKQRLEMAVNEVPMTRERAEKLRLQLSPRETGESVGEWIRRTSQLGHLSTEEIGRDNEQNDPVKLECLAQIIRLAADAGDNNYPLPDPGWVYESDDGRWRLKILSESDTIQLIFEALSYAVDTFAKRKIVFWDKESDKPFASLELDQDGDGSCELSNTLAIRRALSQPYVLIEDK